MTRLVGIDIAAPPLAVVPLFVAALLLLAALAARLTTRLTTKWLRGSAPGPGQPPLTSPLAIPVAAAVLTGGLLVVVPELPLPAQLERWTGNVLSIALVLACALVLARLAVAAVTEYASRNPSVSPALGVTRVALRVLFGILAVLMALQTLGVPVTPILTTLGNSVSLAVALALQDTLANFFAGLYLLADRPVRAGDYVKILDGEEGYVETIGWRSSRIRTLRENIVIVPNQKLSQAILTNFNLPTPSLNMAVAVTVGRDVDAEAVERLLLDEMKGATPQIPELTDAPPVVRLVDFGDAGLVFHCIVTVRDFESQGRAAHELRKRILARLRRERVDILFPARPAAPSAPLDRRPNPRPTP